MHENLSENAREAIPASAALRRQRQYPAEPLWFALMCREIWGANAPKELEYQLGKSDRTCRSWSSGDSDPAATILAALLRGPNGLRVLFVLMQDSDAEWFRDVRRAMRRSAAIDKADEGL